MNSAQGKARASKAHAAADFDLKGKLVAPNELRRILLRYFDLLYGEQIEPLLDLFADEVHWLIVPTATEIHGKPQLRELALNHWRASPNRVKTLVNLFASEEFACLEYISAGTVTADADFGATKIKATGRRYELSCCFVFHFQADGKIDQVREYFDLQTVQRQVSGQSDPATESRGCR